MVTPQRLSVSVNNSLSISVSHFAPAHSTKAPVVCIPGLTRNSADFDDLAPTLAKLGRDVFVFSLRGRGLSDHDPNFKNYHPSVYRNDIKSAFDILKIHRAVMVGTSLGGIVTMLLNDDSPHLIVAAVLNDIGPELAPAGLARIGGYVGSVPSNPVPFDDALRHIRAINEVAFPNRPQSFWETFAKRTFRQKDNGWILNYDPNIARALTEGAPMPDLWGPFKSLAGKPTLVIRGVLSDLLTEDIVEKMQQVHDGFQTCTVADTGHAPTLSEADALASILEFLEPID